MLAKQIGKTDMVRMRSQNFHVFKVSVFGVLRSASDAPGPEDVASWLEIVVRVEKVGFANDLLFH